MNVIRTAVLVGLVVSGCATVPNSPAPADGALGVSGDPQAKPEHSSPGQTPAWGPLWWGMASYEAVAELADMVNDIEVIPTRENGKVEMVKTVLSEPIGECWFHVTALFTDGGLDEIRLQTHLCSGDTLYHQADAETAFSRLTDLLSTRYGRPLLTRDTPLHEPTHTVLRTMSWVTQSSFVGAFLSAGTLKGEVIHLIQINYDNAESVERRTRIEAAKL